MLIVVILLFSSAFFSGSETAFFSLHKVKLEKLKKKTRLALRVERFKNKPANLLSLILMGNALVNIALASYLARKSFIFLGAKGTLVSIFFTSAIIILLGEIFPKIFALYYAEPFSLYASYPLSIFEKIFFPVSWVLSSFSNMLLKIFGVQISASDGALSEEEFKVALSLSRERGFIKKDEEEMIHSVLLFTDTKAKEIMTPRTDVKAIDLTEDLKDLEERLKEFKHSSLPVYKETIDNIVGVLKTKDYFLNKDKPLEDLLREPFFVPESEKIDDILREFLKKKEKVAVVVDEYGGFSGLLTLEDIQEEIFGELYDEYEVPQKKIEKVSENEYLLEASILISDLNYELGLNLPEREETLAGFILSYLERFPRDKEKIVWGDFEFIIENSTRKRILQVRLIIKR